MATIRVKRVYEPAETNDGYRVLVDRIWPRGVSKEKASIGEWLKDVGPSDDLRKWFNHEPERYPEFKKRYASELASNDAFADLKRIVKEHDKVTLVYSARDETHNQAMVLFGLLS